MKENSRSKNAKLNILFGYITQIGIFILSFVGRRIFLQFLSTDYLGINGLYTNILTILSLAELGLDAAVVYSLYKPVADHDTKLIYSLLVFFRKIYFILATGVFIIGVILIPFLPLLIKSDISTKELINYYLLFLANTVASYFVAHKVALLSASQEQRVQKLTVLAFNFVLQVVHIVVLIVFKNYYAYIIATVCTTFLTNIVLGIITERLHPEIFNEKDIVEFDKKPIFKRLYATFLYKIGAVMINSTDNILISVLVSTAAVGLYNNYFVVVTAVTGFIAIITTSMISGIGNLAAKDNKAHQASLFDMMVFFYHVVAACGMIGFSLLFNNLITVWLGEKYLFDDKIVFVISLNFYLTNAISPVWMFREANGLFDEVKYVLLIRAFLNILLSVFLGKIYGVFGIFLATSISLLITNFWVEPRILSRKVLNRSPKVYWYKQIKYFLISVVSYLVCYFATRCLGDSIIMLFIKALMICLITGIFFIIINIKSDEIRKLKVYLLKTK